MEEISEIVKRLKDLTEGLEPTYYTNAFTHPSLLTFTNQSPQCPQLISWGLIPQWTKNQAQAVKLQNQTLNARGETIFEKPSFKASAQKKRCIIMIDGYYEYYHQNKKSYPFFIQHKNQEPMVLGGLWSEWRDEHQELVKTISIVTTKANELTSRIHNRPKQKESRMPLILDRTTQDFWLFESNEAKTKTLITPAPSNQLEAFSVAPLGGKNAKGNHPSACQPYEYEELIWKNQRLF